MVCTNCAKAVPNSARTAREEEPCTSWNYHVIPCRDQQTSPLEESEGRGQEDYGTSGSVRMI